jgi:hypothetical protein
MDTRQIEIACPCCQHRLVIDVRTERVLKTIAPAASDETEKRVVADKDWDKAFSKVKDRESSGTDKMDAFLDSERDRASRLEEKFREAKKKLERPKDE